MNITLLKHRHVPYSGTSSDAALPSHLTDESNFPLRITAPSNSGPLQERLQPFPKINVPQIVERELVSDVQHVAASRDISPFVHALQFSQSRDEGRPSEALVNCMSIAQLFVNSTRETRKFLCGTVKMEQERMWHEVLLCECIF